MARDQRASYFALADLEVRPDARVVNPRLASEWLSLARRALLASVHDLFYSSGWGESLKRVDQPMARELDFAIYAGKGSAFGSAWEARAEPSIDEPHLRKEYSSTNWPEVLAFVRKHAYLHSLLNELSDAARSAFGKATATWLAVVDDPDGGYPQLVAMIDADLTMPERLEALKQLDNTWWTAASRQSRDRLVVTI